MKSVKIKNGEDLLIREASPNDAAAILEYIEIISQESENITFGPSEFGITLEQEKKYLQSILEKENSNYVVGVSNESIIAIADISAGKRPRIKHRGELGISVRKSHWRLGVGKAIITYLIDWASLAGLKKVNLEVREDNLGAIALYESLGFVTEGRITRAMLIHNQYIDTILMGLEL